MRVVDVLITRPIVQARITAHAIEKRGLRPHIVPLVEIVPLEFSSEFIGSDRKFDALLATSSHAFRVAGEELEQFPKSVQRFSDKNCGENKGLEQTSDSEIAHSALAALKGLPLFCVGSRTAQAAKNAGFYQIKAIAETAAQLVCHLASYPAHQFLYLAGKVRRPLLEQQLVVFGHQVSVLELYHQRALCPDEAQLAHLPPRFDAALFYCVTAARSAPILARFFDSRTRLLCLSERIADSLPPMFHSLGRIASHPSEICLLELLNRFCPE